MGFNSAFKGLRVWSGRLGDKRHFEDKGVRTWKDWIKADFQDILRESRTALPWLRIRTGGGIL
jgi:hypothetical protein